MCTDGLANVGLGSLDGEYIEKCYILNACIHVPYLSISKRAQIHIRA